MNMMPEEKQLAECEEIIKMIESTGKPLLDYKIILKADGFVEFKYDPMVPVAPGYDR